MAGIRKGTWRTPARDEASREAFDFSLDSRIREPLLARIKAECYGALSDDALAGLNAAGPIGERAQTKCLEQDPDEQ